MVAIRDEYDLAKRLLLDEFPGMRFEIEGANPKYKNAILSPFHSLVVTYNPDIAAERGINQRHMRDVLRPIIENRSVTYGTNEIDTHDVFRVSFKKKHSPRITVNQDRVQEVLSALSSVENASDSNRETIQRTVEVLREFVPRAQQPFFKAVVDALSSQE